MFFILKKGTVTSMTVKTIGIVGGGQLGQMWIQSAVGFDLEIHVLDPDKEAPCSLLASAG